MRISRTAEAVLIWLLCVLAVLLMLSGCGASDEPTVPVSETETVAEAASAAQPTNADEILATETQTDTETQSEEAEQTGTTPSSEPTESTVETAAAETNASESTDATVPEEETDPNATVPMEETLPEETQLSEELIAAQEENQILQAKVDDLTEQKQKQKLILIILISATVVTLILALVFLHFWRRADAALKKARKRIQRQDPDSPITQIHIGKTHGIGGRSSQQDSFSVSPAELYGQNGVLAVVADGMGGLENGDKASQTAVISAMESFYQIAGTGMERLLQILAVTKSAVNTVQADLGTTECGTTLLMGLIQNGEFHYISVGDSRIYLYRSGRLIQLNREHSYLFDQMHHVVNGRINMDEALANEKNGCITSFLGMREIAHIDIPATAITILPKDKFLLMSDGVYNALTQEEICLAMRHPAQDAAEAIGSFIATKNFQDQDNYTLVILECQ